MALEEDRLLLHEALQRDGVARSLQLAQEVKASLLEHGSLQAREARIAWRLARWQLFNKRRLLLQVCLCCLPRASCLTRACLALLCAEYAVRRSDLQQQDPCAGDCCKRASCLFSAPEVAASKLCGTTARSPAGVNSTGIACLAGSLHFGHLPSAHPPHFQGNGHVCRWVFDSCRRSSPTRQWLGESVRAAACRGRRLRLRRQHG